MTFLDDLAQAVGDAAHHEEERELVRGDGEVGAVAVDIVCYDA